MLKTKKQKDLFRKKIRNSRASKNQDEQHYKSNRIVEAVRNSPAFITAERIAIYHAVNGEANPKKLTALNDTDKHFYLPILAKDKTQGLVFAPINATTKYKNNKFSIPEPIYKENDLVTGEVLDLVIVPLVGFDKKGNRIGMGGGFYDRTFAFKQEQSHKPVLMGFAFDFQLSELIYQESWDVRLDFIATETQLINTQHNT